MTWRERINRTPPVACRVLARNRFRALSYTEIAKRAGMARSTVIKILKLTSWDTVPVGVVDRISQACNVDHDRIFRQKEYVRRGKMSHITRSNPAQRQMFNRIISR